LSFSTSHGFAQRLFGLKRVLLLLVCVCALIGSSIEVAVSWIERVEQSDATHLHWVAEIAGATREWDAEIIEQRPEQRLAWKALDRGGPNGVVTFDRLDDARAKVKVHIDYEPEGPAESIGSFVALDSHRVKADLESFKEFIEGRAHETGGWRNGRPELT
jgi:uncharacterized membrane protein